ncbi:hypothetical protein Sango_0381900 [Sesamum angolense]|uniref:Uncharacterized protein n=1 Tax=Sesamum angolense TaxID=2727404 RepID=A0AAE1X9X1_9LAMI|nr:hypothetical protein Sango_0381900 [Sesamum angolense]
MAIPISKSLPDLSKLEPLDRTNFKRLSQKLLIFFEQLDVDYILFIDPLGTPAQPTETTEISLTYVMKKTDGEAKTKFEKDNKTMKDHILNHMTNTLFDLLSIKKLLRRFRIHWKPGHTEYQCFQKIDQEKTNKKQTSKYNPQVNLVENDEIIVAMLMEANLVENKDDWILDSRASRHLCSNKALFREVLKAIDNEYIFMGNSACRILG